MADQAQLAGPGGESGALLAAAILPTSILLVEPRESVRLELHNFFETAGYNLIEASNAEEAVALGEVHEGSLDVLIAEGAQAGELLTHLRGFHPSLQALSVVEEAPARMAEIRSPFTQQDLLAKVAALVSQRAAGAIAGEFVSG